MEDREVDFDLVEPTGVNGTMNKHQVGIFGLQPSGCLGTPMRRAVVADPENPTRPAIGPLSHHLVDKTVKGRDSILGLASAETTNSLALSLRPFQRRWYKSKMRPALAANCGSRGKIQQRCCQGRMASSFSHRQMVVSLREAGTPKRLGNSQAMALTCTTSSGGENPGSAGALAVF